MLDAFHIPNSTTAYVQEFYANSPVAQSSWHTWQKPRGVSLVSFYLLAGGGAGGGGAAGAASAGAGGGGGGSSAQCNIMYPAWALPDTIYISVGVGGQGGAGAGGSGVASYVSIIPASGNNVLLAFADPGVGGTAAAGATVGTGGAGGLAFSVGSTTLAGLGFASRVAVITDVSLAGQAGTNGGSAAVGVALTLPTTGLTVTGGTGGGGRGANNAAGPAGGTITSIGTPAGAVFPIQAGGLASTANNTRGGDGSNGFRVKPNFRFFYGGTGGGAGGGQLATGIGGGTGGKGAHGSGGGGGGGCATGATPGQGGNGGDGLVIVTAW